MSKHTCNQDTFLLLYIAFIFQKREQNGEFLLKQEKKHLSMGYKTGFTVVVVFYIHPVLHLP